MTNVSPFSWFALILSIATLFIIVWQHCRTMKLAKALADKNSATVSLSPPYADVILTYTKYNPLVATYFALLGTLLERYHLVVEGGVSEAEYKVYRDFHEYTVSYWEEVEKWERSKHGGNRTSPSPDTFYPIAPFRGEEA